MEYFTPEFIKDAFLILLSGSVSVLVAGYFFLRSTAESNRARIDSRIDDLEKLGTDYWLADSEHVQIKEIECSIRSHIKNLSTEIRHLKMRSQNRHACDVAFLVFKKSITDGNYECSGRKAEQDRSNRIQDAALSLKGTLRKFI